MAECGVEMSSLGHLHLASSPSRRILPQVSSVSLSQRQRSMVPSHVFRLGVNLFGDKNTVCRRRVINCNQDDITVKVRDQQQTPETACSDHQDFVDGDIDIGSYKKWLAERRLLRDNIDSFGLSERWLKSKERTILENCQMEKLSSVNRAQLSKEVVGGHAEKETVSVNIDAIGNNESESDSEDSHFRKNRIFSTLDGEHRSLSVSYKQEQEQQFSKLLQHSRKSVNPSLAKKALLLPSEELASVCKRKLPSQDVTLYKMSTRGNYNRSKAVKKKLRTGDGISDSKVDSWLTSKNNVKLTVGTTVPNCHYKKNRHTTDSSFWTNAVMNTHQIDDTPQKTRSHHALFHPIYYRSSKKSRYQKNSWPDNVCGYVQFGSIIGRQCQL